MRIIGGYARGIVLEAPEGREVRPTEDRVKESMFGMLGDLSGKVVVDLFSGTGALGLEALSRGAACVVMVEREASHVAFMEKNLAAVRHSIEGAGQSCGEVHLIRSDVSQVHQQLLVLLGEKKPHVVIADPPYHTSEKVRYCGRELLMDSQFEKWVSAETLLCLEYGADTVMPWVPASPWKLIKNRYYGIRAVALARLAVQEGE